MHPSEAIRGRRSELLTGRRIVIGISGSIAATETPRIVRELVRHGAHVEAVMTKDALGIITAEALRFATGSPPMTEITGDVEHVRHLGRGPGRADLLLLAPATANTLSKIAHGIDDTPVTTFASIALGGGVPVLVAPAMHEDMTRNPAVRENLQRLEQMGVHFVPPAMEEGEAKLAAPETVAAHVLHLLARGPWKGRKVVVIGGSTSEPLDEVRSLTNEGSGRVALSLVTQAFYRGAEVEAWLGQLRVPVPPFLAPKRFTTLSDLRELIKTESKSLKEADAVMVPAALSDFTLKKQAGKIPSLQEKLILELTKAEKVLPELRHLVRAPSLLVGFKLEAGLSPRALQERAWVYLQATGCDALVANNRESMGGTAAEVYLVRPEGKVHPYSGPKDVVAGRLLDDLGESLPPK
ncbi:MAG: bifunctional phosphopantothenoylcysteine decarboxylase/phosphopantothenate--cysteine ligase CoaBC [Euryarchaeota archaeon]|nr:bifunctional phosphopantothenoylcysteine decarboxylase/phosphopantothenate--cysteine ligase CoaBC [Euryarchaeota archaeon]MDE1837352.1 bifunctional phosphopantothenoylcysteine decarboxylase/phosphopantothenate--cysteine ligase CoaBC [Euryarchaeota archaeon]MDE1880916.1 bifunctional phosphopantothenoylcysteine decarboxylase/phosphopantothenate--cysteine ligase CoaBC [Euryarchaeota archaeon]MDE2045630.1 bifunctional phosphopantothenoylcysteine decarboxylase/phosphopantothenate--cysteine ligase 